VAFTKLSLTRGNSQIYSLAFTQSNGQPYNIKNWTVFFTLKSSYNLPDSQAALQKIVTSFADSTSGTSGIANIPIAPADTLNLDVGEYDFDFSVCTAANETFTALKGKFTLDYNVTDSLGTAGTAP
jgi:hypothetical protein